MCSPLLVDIWDHCCVVSRYHDTRMVNIFQGFYQCETNGHYFQHVGMEPGLVFRPATMQGYSSVLDELHNRNDWHPYKSKFRGLEGEWAFLEWNDWSSSTILNGIWLSWWLGLDDLEEECEVSWPIIGTFAEVVNAICLEGLSLLLHWVYPREKGKFMLKPESEKELFWWSE